MTSNIAEFNGQISAFMDDTEGELVDFIKKLGFEVLSRVVKKTPVDTGRARGNWQVTHGTPASGQVNVTGAGEPEPEAIGALGHSTIQKGLDVLNRGTKPFGVVYVSNNVDYILALENGHSGQAPEGMVAVTIAEIEAAFP